MGKGRYKQNRGTDCHHTIGQCCRERAKVQEQTNKQLVDILSHQALNTIVGDKQHPCEQLQIMNKKFGRDKVMSEYAKELFHTLINLPRNEFYAKEILK